MSTRPNVVLIMFDQFRYDAAGFAGSDIVHTPNLDRFADAGAVFEQAYCGSPVCSPARAVWLTGTYPHATTQLGNYGPKNRGRWGHHLPADTVTIGDLFKAAGYRCGMVGPWHLGDDETPQHGFTDLWSVYRYQQTDSTDRYLAYLEERGLREAFDADTREGKISRLWDGKAPYTVSRLPTEHQRTSWTVSRGIEFLLEEAGPSFLFMSIKDPHPPLVPTREAIELYRVEEMPLPPSLDDPRDGKPAHLRSTHFYLADAVDRDEMRRMVAHYFALCTHIDTQLGRFFEALSAAGAAENTIVAVISDHGELLFDHGLFGKGFHYEGAVRVPCVLRWPGRIEAGRRIGEPFAGVDLMPTLLDLAGLTVPDAVHGRSWAPQLVRGAPEPANTVLAEIWQLEGTDVPDRDHLAASIMIRRGRWKYIRHRFDPIEELYDLERDPQERVNVAGRGSNRAVTAELDGLMRGMLRDHGAGPYGWVLADARPASR